MTWHSLETKKPEPVELDFDLGFVPIWGDDDFFFLDKYSRASLCAVSIWE
jgi:hypothetical protein